MTAEEAIPWQERLLPWRVPMALGGIAAFFALYGQLLLNTNLQNLKLFLAILEKAATVDQAEVVLPLVDQAVVSAMAQEETNLKVLVPLQYARDVLFSYQQRRPVEDAQLMLEQLVADETARRPALLLTLDGLVTSAQEVFHRAIVFPRQLLGGPSSSQLDPEQSLQMIRWERLGLLPEALGIYESLLKDYPDYRGRARLRLRLGYLYQQLRQFHEAERRYRRALRQARALMEIRVARQLLAGLQSSQAQARQATLLLERFKRIQDPLERHLAAYRLGCLLIQGYDFEQAADLLRFVRLAYPEGELVLPSLFKRAWCLSRMGRFREAFEGFQEIIQWDPSSPWATASRQQIGQLYQALGDQGAVIKTYDDLLGQATQDPALLTLIAAQAGSTALYDMKDARKSRDYFQKLTQFPASPVSTVESDLQDRQRVKVARALKEPQPLALESPATSWMETALPAIVEMFSNRANHLATFMESTGKQDLTHSFSEQEFRNFVLRRMQEKFPGQIEQFGLVIHPQGYLLSGTLRVGEVSCRVEARVFVQVVNERLHVELPEIRIWKMPVPEAIRSRLADRVNRAVDNLPLPVRVTRYDFQEGSVVIRAELPD